MGAQRERKQRLVTIGRHQVLRENNYDLASVSSVRYKSTRLLVTKPASAGPGGVVTRWCARTAVSQSRSALQVCIHCMFPAARRLSTIVTAMPPGSKSSGFQVQCSPYAK